MDELTDLVEKVKRKDMLAMKLLYERSAKAMLSTSFRITQNLEDSQDILQESYLTSFQQIQKLENPKRYFSWLKRIVVNNSLSAIRNKRHFEEVDKLETTTEDTTDNWYRDVPFAKIKMAIDQLPNGCREIFSLYLLEGYKHREIADMLQVSLSTSKSQYQYALRLMREKLIQYR